MSPRRPAAGGESRERDSFLLVEFWQRMYTVPVKLGFTVFLFHNKDKIKSAEKPLKSRGSALFLKRDSQKDKYEWYQGELCPHLGASCRKAQRRRAIRKGITGGVSSHRIKARQLQKQIAGLHFLKCT